MLVSCFEASFLVRTCHGFALNREVLPRFWKDWILKTVVSSVFCRKIAGKSSKPDQNRIVF